MLLLASVGFAEKFLTRHLSEARQGKEADFATPGRSAGITKTTHKGVKSSWRYNNGPKLHLQWIFFPGVGLIQILISVVMTEKSESARMVCGTDGISCFLF